MRRRNSLGSTASVNEGLVRTSTVGLVKVSGSVTDKRGRFEVGGVDFESVSIDIDLQFISL